MDYSNTRTYDYTRSIARQQDGDSAKGACANFFIEVVNQTPYDDALALMLELVDPGYETVATLGENDIIGLSMEADGEGKLPDLSDIEGTRRYRVEVCPSGGDDRVFDARNTEMSTGSIVDASGAAMSGYVYCNLAIRVSSRCEREYTNDWTKGDLKTSGQTMCDAWDPMIRQFGVSGTQCYEDILPEIFDGSDTLTKITDAEGKPTTPIQFTAENQLQRELLIPCLSFDRDTDLCASNTICTGQ
ncbi:hypothetical protein TL16_g00893 [Triparma laevis f. inornata]|uniref:Uncharacterized protein n=1 Tax=Triparma laevis f. inornata TaxID=1714386 RepID=A0A9W6ZEQ8_9STRA|nr:hypothetical protein TL16_g00893 [Triparma laevis f. inornata]